MIHLLRLEFMKFKRSKFPFVLLGLVLIIFGSYFFYIDQKEVSIEWEKENVQSNYDIQKTSYEEKKAKIEATDGEIDARLQREFSRSERDYNNYLLIYEGINSNNWSMFLQGYINFYQYEEEKSLQELELVAKSYTWPTPFTIFSGMDRLRWMEERNIRPIFPTQFFSWRSIYDEEFKDLGENGLVDNGFKEFIIKSSDKHSSSGFYFTYEALQYGFSIFGVIFFIFLFGDILTREGFGKNGPIQMIRTQPIRRWKFWLSKGVTVIGGSLLIIMFVMLIGIGLGIIFNRLGDWDYPILIYGPERTYSFLPLAVFIGKALGLFLLILALGFSLLFLFSVLTNRAITAIGLTLVVLFGGQMLTEQATLLSWTHWLPFHYFDVYAIVNGEYAILQKNELYTYNNAILSLSVTVALLLLITVVVGKLRKGVIS